MYYSNDYRKNVSGCSDPTAYAVLKKDDEEEKRFHKLLDTIHYVSECAGFEIEGRIVLTDCRTGRTWR